MRPSPAPRSPGSRFPTVGARAFTLVELIVVILIISIIMAIVIPSLGAARSAVRKTQTRATMTDLLNAYNTFKNDNEGRAPGQFSQRDLGSQENTMAAFTPMENAMLDLLGEDAVIGRVSDVDADNAAYPQYDASAEAIIKVGTDAGDEDKQFYVNTQLLGAGDAYFKPDEGAMVAQTNNNNNDLAGQYTASAPTTAMHGNFANTAGDNIAQMPDLVDAFGQPILLWVPDEFGPQVRTSSKGDALDDFVLDPGDAGDPTRSAVFYPHANIGFLASKSLGVKQLDMTGNTSSAAATSAIGFEGQAVSGFDDNNRRTFMALFGNPAFPTAAGSISSISAAVNARAVIPAKPRGEVIIHSAGIDGIYFSTRDAGFRSKGAADDQLEYWQNFEADGNSFDNDDLAAQFDDVLITGN